MTLFDTIPAVGAAGPGWATAVRTVLRGITRREGSWEDMQALVDPVDGQPFYALDQQIDYRYNSTAAVPWQRAFGNVDEIWVTDHGALGNGVADDSDAIDAADAEAVLTSSTPYSGRGTVVYFPRIGSSDASAGSYKITRTIERPVGVSWVGGNGRHAAQHSRSRPSVIVGTSVPSPDPAVIIGDGVSNAQWIHDRNIGIYGNNIGLSIYRCSFVSTDYCWYAAIENADDENAALRIEDSFTLTFDHWNAVTGSTANGQFAVRLVATSDPGGLGGPIQGVANTTFRHGFMDLGGVVFENRTNFQAGNSEEVIWEDVITESHLGQPFLTFLGGGDVPHSLVNWEFTRCVRADSNGVGTGPTDSQAFIKLDANGGAGRITLYNAHIRGCNPYTQWLIQCVGATKPDVIGLHTDTVGTGTGLVWDPANTPFNRGIGTVIKNAGGPTLQAHSHGDPSLAKTGSANTAYAAGQSEQAYNRWAAGADSMVWGDGTSEFDTKLGRVAAGVLGVLDTFEFPERADPAAPAANKARLYCKDNGAGKTQLVVRFPTGAVQQVALEP